MQPAIRIRNAAHYEYVLRLLNHAPANLYAPPAGAAPVEEQAAAHTLKTAWIQSIQLYVRLLKYRSGDLPANAQDLKNISRLLGLSVHKGGTLSDGDLAVAENRVCKLGVMFGAVGLARDNLVAWVQP